MADKKVSQLTESTTLSNTDILYIGTDNGDSTYTSQKIQTFTLRNQIYQGITTTDSTYEVDNLYNVIFCDAQSNDIQVILPDCTAFTNEETRIYIIKKTDNSNNLVTITSTDPTVQTIDGEEYIVINNQYDSISIVSNGNLYYIV